MNISYDYYRVFYYVAKYKSFTGAAKALLNNQPNITRMMKKLEEELGCTLFVRQRYGIILTPEGEKLYAHISVAFEHILCGEEEIARDKSLQSGIVTVAASEIALHCVLLSVLKTFRKNYPGIRIRILNQSTPQAIDMLKKGLHNHIVVNSVSFMDGRMFRNDFTTYYKGIRAVSDELCRENRLSVVETDGHGKSYGEWKHEKEGTPTLRGMVKTDVEMAMTAADSFAGFIAELQKMGYAVKYGPKTAHMTVRHKEAQKNIRLDKVSTHFSEDSLRRYFRELQTLPPEMQQEYKQQTAPEPPRRQPKEQPMPVRRRARYCGKLNYKCRKITGFMACYYRYCALLRKAYKGKVGNRCYYLLRDDFLKYNRYRRQCDLLWGRQITTLDEMLTYKENLQAEYNALTTQRKALYRKKSKTTPADYSEQIQAITARIRELRREITTCADIEMDCGMVQDKVQRAKQPEKAELRVAENTHYNHVCAYGSHH